MPTITVELVECGCCGSYHLPGYYGECRDDANRFPVPCIPYDDFTPTPEQQKVLEEHAWFRNTGVPAISVAEFRDLIDALVQWVQSAKSALPTEKASELKLVSKALHVLKRANCPRAKDKDRQRALDWIEVAEAMLAPWADLDERMKEE